MNLSVQRTRGDAGGIRAVKRYEWMSRPFISSLQNKLSKEGNLEEEHIHK